MRVALIAVGRLARGPERTMVDDYAARATATGRSLGLGPVELVELDIRKGGVAAEGAALLAAAGEEALTVACDEHGEAWTSRELAQRVARWRDDGVRRLAFVVGGADGLAPNVLAHARGVLAFGPQTWPHALARVMLAEQIYRAATLIAGSPYHRDEPPQR